MKYSLLIIFIWVGFFIIIMEPSSVDLTVVDGSPREVPSSYRNHLTLDIAGAAIFGALSIGLSLTITRFLPRVWAGNGPAFFDPISIIWLSAFLIFGFRCGLLTTIIGTLGLLISDPTVFMVGPFMKFVATIWFIIIPYLFIRIKNLRTPTGEDMRDLNNYIPSMVIAWVIRSVIMLGLNYLYLFVFWGGTSALAFTSLSWLGLDSVAGHLGYIITIFLLNTLQTLGDVIIPYVLVFSTKIYDRFKIY